MTKDLNEYYFESTLHTLELASADFEDFPICTEITSG